MWWQALAAAGQFRPGKSHEAVWQCGSALPGMHQCFFQSSKLGADTEVEQALLPNLVEQECLRGAELQSGQRGL
jgi:hypothetical protein